MKRNIKLPLNLHEVFSSRSLKKLGASKNRQIARLAAMAAESNKCRDMKELFFEYLRQNPPNETEWLQILLSAADIIDERYEADEIEAAKNREAA